MNRVKITNKLISKLKKYMYQFSVIEDRFYRDVGKLEKEMKSKTGIKDIEFFFCDGECVGVGTPACPEQMSLLHREKLERSEKCKSKKRL